MSKIKITPNYKKKADPTVAEYWKTFNAGRDYERKIAVEYFVGKIRSLGEIEGIGTKTMQKIEEFINKEWGN